MKSKNRMKKYSLIVSLVLALSLAISPVSAFAEELDTPVHEDPIDEIQHGADWVNGHFTLYQDDNTIVLDVRVYCYFSWTEGIGGQIHSVAFNFDTITMNGEDADIIQESNITYESYNTWGKASKVFTFSKDQDTAVIEIRVYCDDYGDLSISAGEPIVYV